MGLRSSDANVTKSRFPKLWQKAIKQGASCKVIQSAFRRSGIFPFDPCAIDTSKISHRKYVCFIECVQFASKYNEVIIFGTVYNPIFGDL